MARLVRKDTKIFFVKQIVKKVKLPVSNFLDIQYLMPSLVEKNTMYTLVKQKLKLGSGISGFDFFTIKFLMPGLVRKHIGFTFMKHYENRKWYLING